MAEAPLLINRADNTRIRINKTPFSIGHSRNCDYIVNISRFHWTISKHGAKWMLFNQSGNRMMVNNESLYFYESKELHSGDIIQLGDGSVQFIFQNPKDETVLLTAFDNLTLTPLKGNRQPPPPPPQKSLSSLFTNQNKERTLTTNTNQNQNINQSQSVDMMETELTCSICSELFIKAITLNCSHTFCKHCIEQWKKNQASCPICRTEIKSQASSLVLDNLIDKIMETRPSDEKSQRAELIDQRNNIDKERH